MAELCKLKEIHQWSRPVTRGRQPDATRRRIATEIQRASSSRPGGMAQKMLSRETSLQNGAVGRPAAGRKSVELRVKISVKAVPNASSVRPTPYTFVQGSVLAASRDHRPSLFTAHLQLDQVDRHLNSCRRATPRPGDRRLFDHPDCSAIGRVRRRVANDFCRWCIFEALGRRRFALDPRLLVDLVEQESKLDPLRFGSAIQTEEILRP